MAETCRFTAKPLAECKCAEGCLPKQMKGGEWAQPIRKGYTLQCCDCGLVHSMDFRVHKGKIQFRAYRVDEKGERIK